MVPDPTTIVRCAIVAGGVLCVALVLRFIYKICEMYCKTKIEIAKTQKEKEKNTYEALSQLYKHDENNKLIEKSQNVNELNLRDYSPLSENDQTNKVATDKNEELKAKKERENFTEIINKIVDFITKKK